MSIRPDRYYLSIVFLLFTHSLFAQSDTIPTYKNCQQCIVLCEQAANRIAILDPEKRAIVWEWRPDRAPAIKAAHVEWFKLPSDAKPVYGGSAILMSASGGGVALIRIADQKVLFYAYAGGNTHSAELLPDGNIVAASSNGNFMTVFNTNGSQFPDSVYSKQVFLEFGHNVVWDKKRKVLWSASKDQLKSFTYNFNKQHPDLVVKDSIHIFGTDAHDLFPVFGQAALWITNTTGTYQYDAKRIQLNIVPLSHPHVKSITSGPKGWPTIFTFPDGTKGSWWTDEIHTSDGNVLYKQAGWKLYKVRWFVENEFSY